MIHKNDTFWYNKINFREGIENMKKIVLFLLAGFMMISVMACSKDEETVQDVMEKVQQNYTDVFGLEMDMDASYTISLSGLEMKADMKMETLQENLGDPKNLAMEMDMELSMLGQTMSMKEWVKDGVAYIDDFETKTKQELDNNDLSELDGKFGAISKDSLKEFSENAQMEKTNDGYIISGSSDYAKMLEEIIESLGLAESLGTEVSEALSSLKIESFNIKYTITNDYEIENAHIDFKATMSVDDQEVAMDLNLDMNIKTYDQTQIKYPDFSEWDNPSENEDVSSVSCSYEGEGISELMMMHAEDDTVVEIESYMVVDYATYDIGSDEEKEAFMENMKSMYQAYEGVECSVDDLGEEMGIAIAIDMNKVSLSTLVELGLASGDSIEGQGFSLMQSIIGLEASGYDCE